MPGQTLGEVALGCKYFVHGHLPKSVAQFASEVALSQEATIRNDHYGKGGVIAEFEADLASLLGKEAAVFMPSGVMAQLIAVRIWSDRSNTPTIAYHPTCHLELAEEKAYRELHGLDAVLIGTPESLFTLDDLRQNEKSVSTLLLELPQRVIGGQLPEWSELVEICDFARSQGTRVHLDGARLWECAPYYQRSYAEIAALFDSVYVSFYKTIGALPGALLAGPQDFIDEARIWQRRHGGNLHQQSINVISAKLALKERLPKIGRYVEKAQQFADMIRQFDQVKLIPEFPPTNMMHLQFSGDRESLLPALVEVADQDKILLFGWLDQQGRTEIAIGDGALDLSDEEFHRAFSKLLTIAGSMASPSADRV